MSDLPVRTPRGFPLPHGIVVRWEELEYVPELQAWIYKLRCTDTPLPQEFWGQCESDGVSIVGGVLFNDRTQTLEYIERADVFQQPRHIAFRTYGAFVPVQQKELLLRAVRAGVIPQHIEGEPYVYIEKSKIPHEAVDAQSAAASGSQGVAPENVEQTPRRARKKKVH